MKAKITLTVSVALFAATTLARADEWNQRTEFTFSAPVEVPGQVLPAGTYIFKLADSSSDRNIIQVFSKNEKHLYGTFLGIPDYRIKPADKSILTFSERPVGSPEAIKAWFYPGQNYGHEFVYPKPKAAELAKANNTPVPSMPAELAANTTTQVASMQEPAVVALKTTPLKAQQPTEEEVEIAEVFITAEPADAPPLKELPKTASNMPLIGITGLIFLGAAFGARRLRAVQE
jgi:hypothetical protein